MNLKRLGAAVVGVWACWIVACNGDVMPTGGVASVDPAEIAGAGGGAGASRGADASGGATAGGPQGAVASGSAGRGTGGGRAASAGGQSGPGAGGSSGTGGGSQRERDAGASRQAGGSREADDGGAQGAAAGIGGRAVGGSGGASRGQGGGGGSAALHAGGNGSGVGGAAGRRAAGGNSEIAGRGQGGSAAADAGRPAAGGRASDAGAAGNVKVSVYLASDSTVQTYNTSQLPQQGWGQRLQEFFASNVTIVNKAMGGRSSKSFIDEGRLDEILGLIRPGDYLFAQWGINDRYTSDDTRYTNPATTFRTYLKMYIDGARSKNAIPVLLTPTPRLDYSNGAFQNDFPEYCKAIFAVGEETDTPVIDLQSKGLAYYTSVGYDYVSTTITLDVLHFKTEGAYQMARLVAEGVRELDLSISPYVK